MYVDLTWPTSNTSQLCSTKFNKINYLSGFTQEKVIMKYITTDVQVIIIIVSMEQVFHDITSYC